MDVRSDINSEVMDKFAFCGRLWYNPAKSVKDSDGDESDSTDEHFDSLARLLLSIGVKQGKKITVKNTVSKIASAVRDIFTVPQPANPAYLPVV